MRSFAIALALLALPSCARAQTVTLDPQNRSVTADMQTLPVHYGGRARVDPFGGGGVPKRARAYFHQWPGLYFEAAFTGDAVTLKFDDAANAYRLTINEGRPIEIAPPGRAEVRVEGLPEGAHRLRLDKLTEGSPGQFQGFYVPAGATPGKVEPRQRRIEFIGDSSMSGLGMRAGKTDCTWPESLVTTDAARSYPSLAARHFDADYQLNAYSGRGVVRNFGGISPQATMPKVYPFITHDLKVPYFARGWQPQIVVIRLVADFVGALKPEEKWKNFDALMPDYAAGYAKFISDIHRRSPDAAFLIVWFERGQLADPFFARLAGEAEQTIRDAATKAGVRRIDFQSMAPGPYERTACGGHYSAADHQKMAQWLIDYVEANPELWGTR